MLHRTNARPAPSDPEQTLLNEVLGLGEVPYDQKPSPQKLVGGVRHEPPELFPGGPRPARRRSTAPGRSGSGWPRTPPQRAPAGRGRLRRPALAGPWGLDADPIEQLTIDEELKRARVRRPVNPIGIGWAGPTLLRAGTEAQKDRWLWPMISGEEMWCQLFSEPGAGSDLASLGTAAVLDGDEWVVSGQKVWTSLAHFAKFGILLARTDREAPQHRGISYFVCPMDSPGIDVRPLVDMTGAHAFNEVFFDDVRIPADHLIGEANHGWELAKVTLDNERVSLSAEGALWGRGPTAQDLVDLVRAIRRVKRRGVAPAPGHRVVRGDRSWARCGSARPWRRRPGRARGPESSVRKALADAHGQHLMNLGRDLAGPFGMLAGTGPTGTADTGVARRVPLLAGAHVGGGTAEVQRNIVGERVLGLPRDPPAT
jgi:alkylation response protein AidB-like acyl-CoA dehydrogenase